MARSSLYEVHKYVACDTVMGRHALVELAEGHHYGEISIAGTVSLVETHGDVSAVMHGARP